MIYDLDGIKTLLKDKNKVKLTKAIKDDIIQTGNAYGIKVRIDCKCRNKWFDALIEIYSTMKRNRMDEIKNKGVRTAYKWCYSAPTYRWGDYILSKVIIGTDLFHKIRNDYPGLFDRLFELVEN